MFINYLLKKNGNKVIYFGKNIPFRVLKGYSESKGFTRLLFHLVTNLTNKEPDEYVRQISKQFPDKEIIMSGSHVQYVTEIPDNVRLLRSMNEILAFAKEGTAAVPAQH